MVEAVSGTGERLECEMEQTGLEVGNKGEFNFISVFDFSYLKKMKKKVKSQPRLSQRVETCCKAVVQGTKWQRSRPVFPVTCLSEAAEEVHVERIRARWQLGFGSNSSLLPDKLTHSDEYKHGYTLSYN